MFLYYKHQSQDVNLALFDSKVWAFSTVLDAFQGQAWATMSGTHGVNYTDILES